MELKTFVSGWSEIYFDNMTEDIFSKHPGEICNPLRRTPFADSNTRPCLCLYHISQSGKVISNIATIFKEIMQRPVRSVLGNLETICVKYYKALIEPYI